MEAMETLDLINAIIILVITAFAATGWLKARDAGRKIEEVEKELESDEKIWEKALREKDKEIELLQQKVNELEKRADDTDKCFSGLRP